MRFVEKMETPSTQSPTPCGMLSSGGKLEAC